MPLNGGKCESDRWYHRHPVTEFVMPMCVSSDMRTVERTHKSVATRDAATGSLNRHPDNPERFHPTISYVAIHERRTLRYAIDRDWSFADSYDFMPSNDPLDNIADTLINNTQAFFTLGLRDAVMKSILCQDREFFDFTRALPPRRSAR